MSQQSILVLSHQGYSLWQDILAICQPLAIKVHVLASKIANPAMAEALAEADLELTVTENDKLTAADVSAFLTQHHNLSACIAPFEGYRSLMAMANQQLGVADLSVDEVKMLLDKLALRERLREVGLSQKWSGLVDSVEGQDKMARGDALFVKPRQGIASAATFKVKEPTKLAEQLAQCRKKMESDVLLRAALDEEIVFILEDFIDGIECSFELIIDAQGQAQVLAVHEKVGLEENNFAVLETQFCTPPIHIDEKTVQAGSDFVLECLRRLTANPVGCFHIEAKVDNNGHWEIIEINPRAGGGLVDKSVQILHQDNSLLSYWIFALLGLSMPQIEKAQKGLYFRLYFGQANTKINDIVTNPDLAPVYERIHVAKGNEMPDTPREMIIAEALWAVEDKDISGHLARLAQQSEDYLRFEVEPIAITETA